MKIFMQDFELKFQRLKTWITLPISRTQQRKSLIDPSKCRERMNLIAHRLTH